MNRIRVPLVCDRVQGNIAHRLKVDRGPQHFSFLRVSRTPDNHFPILLLEEPAMTSRMYQVQTAAFDAADSYRPPVTNSTPQHPPVHTVKIDEACKAKQEALAHLPTNCSHCGTTLSGASCIVEIKSGDVMAYCRDAGGCGKSQVLFCSVPLTVPTYKQVCVFKSAPTAARSKQDEAQGVDVYALHGISRPDAVCLTCNKAWTDHVQGYDSNGWVQVRSALWFSFCFV
jgi:hypothetical protein